MFVRPSHSPPFHGKTLILAKLVISSRHSCQDEGKKNYFFLFGRKRWLSPSSVCSVSSDYPPPRLSTTLIINHHTAIPGRRRRRSKRGKKQKRNTQCYCFNLFPPSVHACRKLEGNSNVSMGAWDASEPPMRRARARVLHCGEKKNQRVESGARNHTARFHQRPVIKSQFIFTSCRLSRAREQLGADSFYPAMSLATGAAARRSVSLRQGQTAAHYSPDDAHIVCLERRRRRTTHRLSRIHIRVRQQAESLHSACPWLRFVSVTVVWSILQYH